MQRARVICNGAITPAAALALGADGVHLGEASLFAASSRPAAREVLLSAACHDAASLRQARRIGADLVTLSPVKPTLTHPGAPALGWHGFAQCIAQAGPAIESAAALPARPAIYALGGMTREDLPDARAWRARRRRHSRFRGVLREGMRAAPPTRQHRATGRNAAQALNAAAPSRE